MSLPGGRGQSSKASVIDKTADEDENEEEGHGDDAMEVDEEENRAATPRDKSKGSKGSVGKVSTRRSGRNR